MKSCLLPSVKVVNATDRYFLDGVRLVGKFHKEYLTQYYGPINQKVIEETVQWYLMENAQNAFLLIVDDKGEDKCVGLLAGVEVKSKLSNDRFFHENIWYVEKPYGRYGIYLINEVQKQLKSRGFNNILMAVIENLNAPRIKDIYEHLGFKQIETHFVKGL